MRNSIPLLFLVLCFETITLSTCNNSTNTSTVDCIESERQALLKLKQGLVNLSGKLPFWHGRNCCSWAGVTCEETLGFVSQLDLSGQANVSLGGEINPSLLQLTHLKVLRISAKDSKEALLPSFIGSIHNLETLYLANFVGSLPPELGNLSKLQSLYLYNNKFNGGIPKSLGKLSNLTSLNLIENSWENVMSEPHFANLTRLRNLKLSSTSLNSLCVDVSPNWIPPFNASIIDLQDCQVGPKFPSWLRTQTGLNYLFLRNTGISDSIPDWFERSFANLYQLEISNNHITGRLPFDLSSTKSSSLALPALAFLVLRNNSFSEPISSNIFQVMPHLEYLDLSSNLIFGELPSTICNMTRLEFMRLSANRLSGEIPRCSWERMRLLDLGNNNLTGKIPVEMGFSRSINFLKLRNNKLYGQVPPSLQQLKDLVTLDLGENSFSGDISAWMGESLLSLKALRLRSNFFTGLVPLHLCNLSSLKIIDLGHNTLSGSIPKCIGNLSALAMVGGEKKLINSTHKYSRLGLYFQIMDVIVVKGRELDYSTNLYFLNSIDLSNNNLSGHIPVDLTKLLGLNILNLSMNHLSGMIPRDIGKLEHLESLDLSQNQLSGTIPPSMSDLNYLNHLNFSNNNLSGRIISSNQLQTLNDSSIYEGNAQLCGPPLTRKCQGDETRPNSTFLADHEDEDETDTMWFYICLATGFLVGFGGVCGSLLLSGSWRRTYFQYCADAKNGMVDFIAVIRHRLQL